MKSTPEAVPSPAPLLEPARPPGLRPRMKSSLASFFSWMYRGLDQVRGRGLARELARHAVHLPPEGLVELLTAAQLPQRMDYARHDIYLMATSEAELRRLRSASKEPWTIDWIERHVRPGDVFYDIGANVGAYALVAAKCTHGQARVYAFEPGCTSYASLCKNIVLNGCQGSVIPLPVALSDRTEVVSFRYTSLLPGEALHTLAPSRTNGPAGSLGTAALDQPMLGYRLDDLIDCFRLPMPAHIKLDVDSAEAAVLRGAAQVLAHPELRTVMMELNGEDADVAELIRLLAAGGLELTCVARRPDPASPAYGLFVRAGAAATIR